MSKVVKGAAAATSNKVIRSFHEVEVDGRQVQLRVFVPEGDAAATKPAVVMVCGLLWMGDGVLGRIGLVFNDGFGYAFARSGAPCVQLHSPCRHMAHTRMMDMLACLLWPLGYFPILRVILAIVDVLLLATTTVELLPLLLLPWLWSITSTFGGLAAVPLVHLAIRGAQWSLGLVPGPERRPHQREIGAAVGWAQSHKELLGSDGRLVLCGYSSGGHCAALYGVSPGSPKFEAVVLISGIYSLRTHTWTGAHKFFAPAADRLFSDILGVNTPKARDEQSPDFVCGRAPLAATDWYMLSAEMELMGLQPFEDILFQTKPLCDALSTAGAKVHRVTCGLNHWLLVLRVGDFFAPFVAGLDRPRKEAS